MKKIQMYRSVSADPPERVDGMDFGIFGTNKAYDTSYFRNGDVVSFWVGQSRRHRPFKTPEMDIAIDAGCRVNVGNYIGGDLTVWLDRDDPARTVDRLLHWADKCYDMVGNKLVLSPMHYDILHDEDGKFMRWCAERGVPQIWYMGFMFLFTNDPTSPDYIPAIMKRKASMPSSFPHDHLRNIMVASGVEVWIGAGQLEGLKAGVVQKAEQFGFKGVLTMGDIWEAYTKNEGK